VTPSTAIVTLAVGPGYAERWRRDCAANWGHYAERHGYDVVCLDEPLDVSARARRRSPAWQKCLVLGQPFAADYERIVWIDSDVLINPSAPPIAAGLAPEKVGAVDEYSTPSREVHRENLRKLYAHWEATGVPFVHNETAREYYEVFGLPGRFDEVVQTGVMVLSPSHHRDLLERVYETYEDRGAGWNFEMRPLSWELLDADCVEWLDPRFNYIWGNYKARHFPFLLNHPAHPHAAEAASRSLRKVFFMHFAGSVSEMRLAVREPPTTPAAPAADRRRVRRIARTSTPVVLLVFARPRETARVLEAVRRARPSRLLVVADAPRPDVPGEADQAAAVRGLVADVDWDCEVDTNYAERHMGLRARVESGLTWAFSTVDEAIVLEDDCLPHPSFFGFCDELLARYRDDERVWSISGDNIQWGADRPVESYYFSHYTHIWGWATWRRAWERHDPSSARWPELRDAGWLDGRFDDPHAVRYWTHLFQRSYESLDTWDYAWGLSCWLGDALHVVPRVNLVSNIGFGPRGTHTNGDHRGVFGNLPVEEIGFPLRHPAGVRRSYAADAFTEDVMFSGNLRRMFERLHTLQRRRAAGMAS
jgi:hypothetical protein